MQIKKLKIGQVLKNYKALCEVLEIEPKTSGKSRKLQEEEIKRYVNYHLEGRKYVVDEIVQEVAEKMDKRTLGNNNYQARCIRYILLDFLCKCNLKQDEVIGFSKGSLLRKLNLVNTNYVNAKGKSKEFAQALEVERLAIDECIEYVDNRSINAIKKAIQVLINQKVIGYKYSYSWVDAKGILHHADVIEHNAILDAEYHVMEKMNIRNKKIIWEYSRWEEFKSKVAEYLLEEYPILFKNFRYYYASFHFHYNIENLKSHMEYMEQRQDMSKEVATIEIQSLWSKTLETTIKNTSKKAKEEGGWGKHPDPVINYRKSDNYIQEQTRVKNSIVDLEHKKVEINEQLKLDLDTVPF